MRGWAEDDGEHEDFRNCVALPVFDARGQVTLSLRGLDPRDICVGSWEFGVELVEIRAAGALPGGAVRRDRCDRRHALAALEQAVSAG